jgi:mRNA interferase RelE/StbE
MSAVAYTVEWERLALKQLDGIDAPDRARILSRVTALADNPRPSGVVKLARSDDVWRIRIGDYRVLYTII